MQKYIFRVPEIGEEHPENNPLHKRDGLPEFNNITIENCRAAIAKQTQDFETGLKRIEQNILDNNSNVDVFKDVIEPLDELGSTLDITWGCAKTLYLGNNTLMPTNSYLAMHKRAKAVRAARFDSKTIYNTIKDALASGKYSNNPEETRVLQKFATEGKLNGLDLKGTDSEYLISYISSLAKERKLFRQKIDLATHLFRHTIKDVSVIKDFPRDILDSISTNPKDPLNGPWKLTLQPHVYKAVMEYCPDRTIRFNIWRALVIRGSNDGDNELRTSLHLEEIRFLRKKLANILGYETFVDMSMETKMAGSVQSVQNMINVLLSHAKPMQDKEIENLYEFAKERGFNANRLALWDVPYWRRKQLKSAYEYDEQQIKEYFPLNKVLDGLFQLCEKLFNIVVKQRSDVSVWHKDVRFYDIFEPHSSAPIGGFYLDPYARSEDKNIHASNGWMISIQNQSRVSNTKPLAALVFNFDPPQNGQYTTNLTFKQVKSLFIKFGHALHHLLSRTNYSEVSGLSNVEWDCVEVSGLVLSHWLYNKSVMDSISSHCDSEDKLPPHLFDTIVNANRHLAGFDLCRDLYLSALDIELHTSKKFWLDIIKKMWPMYRSFPLDTLDSHPLWFTQIVCDEWGAAYYSHVWSRMIAADVFSAFHEAKDDEQQVIDVGKRFRNTFLALGGSLHSSQIFRQFRGRDPSPKALLSSVGLKNVDDVNVN